MTNLLEKAGIFFAFILVVCGICAVILLYQYSKMDMYKEELTDWINRDMGRIINKEYDPFLGTLKACKAHNETPIDLLIVLDNFSLEFEAKIDLVCDFELRSAMVQGMIIKENNEWQAQELTVTRI